MKKKLLSLALAAVLLTLCGCSSLLKKEYLSVEDYTDGEHNEFSISAKEVSSYAELKRKINEMVENHVDEERLRFTNYDGAIHNDLSQAFREVEEETALGSFSVNYMYIYEIGRFITYYEATVCISFSRTQEEIDAVTAISGRDELLPFLDEAMSSLVRYAAIRMSSADISEDYIVAAVDEVFNANPASCVLRPKPAVSIHPASGFDHIIEIELDYGRPSLTISNMKIELTQAIDDILSGLNTESEQVFAAEAYNALAAAVAYDPDGELRREAELLPSLKSSVYGALVEGISDSLGLALAFSALSREAGVNCLVVTGTLDKVEHSWNIIEIDGVYYHVDVSADSTLGITGAFGRSDSQMRGSYWWFIEDYPECPASLNAADIFSVSE